MDDAFDWTLHPSNWSPEQFYYWVTVLLPPFIRAARLGLYWQAAATAVVVYDHMTTFDQEVELVWSQSWSLVKVLYILNRYIGDALFLHGSAAQFWVKGELMSKTCHSALQIQSWLGMIALFTMNGIIIKRVSCMYAGNKGILCLLLAAYAIHIIAGVVLTGLTVPHGGGSVVPLTATEVFCSPGPGTVKWFWSFLFFTSAFELLVFGLSLFQGVRFFREKKCSTSRGGPQTMSIVNRIWNSRGNFASVLIRDSISFPLIGLILGLLNILAYAEIMPHPTIQIIIVTAAASSPILGCRLVLNLRDAYYKPFHVEFDQSQAPPDDIYIPSLNGSSPSRPSSPAIFRRRSSHVQI